MASRPQLPERDWESLAAEEVVAAFLEAFPGRVSLACSFQKEESVLLDMVFAVEPKARVFALDTHVLFPETYDVWREVERRYGTRVEVYEGPSLGRQAAVHGDALWERNPTLCCAIRKVEPLGRALARARRLDHRPAARPVARPGRTPPRSGWTQTHELWKANPLADWDDERCCCVPRRARPALQPAARPRLRVDRLHALHAGPAPAARVAGPGSTRPNAASTSRTSPRTTAPRRRRSADEQHRHVSRARAAQRPRARARVRPLVDRPLRRRQVDDRRPRRRRARAARARSSTGSTATSSAEHLSKGLGFSKADRDTNIERIGWVASRLARAGAAVVVSAISPYEEARQRRAPARRGARRRSWRSTSPPRSRSARAATPRGSTRRRTRARSPSSRASPTRTRSRPVAELRLDTEGRTPGAGGRRARATSSSSGWSDEVAA